MRNSLKARQTAQMLITASFLDDYHLPRLVDEALDEDGPEAITASLMGFLDALPTSAWCVIKPLLESCVEIIRGLAQYAGCEPEQMLTTYWISLEDARA